MHISENIPNWFVQFVLDYVNTSFISECAYNMQRYSVAQTSFMDIGYLDIIEAYHEEIRTSVDCHRIIKNYEQVTHFYSNFIICGDFNSEMLILYPKKSGNDISWLMVRGNADCIIRGICNSIYMYDYYTMKYCRYSYSLTIERINFNKLNSINDSNLHSYLSLMNV